MPSFHRPTLILLHGALGASEQLSTIMPLLEKTYSVYTFNFSGHGGTPFNVSGFNINVFTEELIAFMDLHGLDRASFFGHSMGGYVALNAALKFASRVEKIFTLGTKLEWTRESASREVKQLNPEKILEKIPKFAEALKQRHAPNDWIELMEKTATLMLVLGNGEALSKEDFATIQHEVQLGIGTLDNMVSIEETSAVSSVLPNGHLQVIESFKHPIEQVDTQELADKIIELIK